MIKVIDITYYSDLDLYSIEQIRQKHRLSVRYNEFLSKDLDLTFIMHAGFEACEEYRGVKYHVFKGVNKFFFLPFKSSFFIARHKPDVVLIQGLSFPVQVMVLKLLNPRVKVLIQHHGERPFTGFKLLFQQLAANFVNCWLFTAKGNSFLWKQKHVIPAKNKICELLEASTEIRALDYAESRSKFGIKPQEDVFLWVGRLVEDKNPLLVIETFRNYVTVNGFARLYLIYQTDDLLAQVKATIDRHPELKQTVHLVGKVPHIELAAWYSAADFYLSASNREGSGYALLEALACGCMPVVSDIPPFRKITADGKFSSLYKTGDAGALLQALLNLKRKRIDRQTIIDYFKRNLSFNRIAADMDGIIHEVCSYKDISLPAMSSAANSNTGS